jgi:K(+)-stimulated pyrophosphate-energized sodium pump
VGIGLVYVIMVILFHLLLVPLVIVFALLLAVMGAFIVLAVSGHATTIITGLAISLQAAVLPVTVIAAGIWIAYSVDGGLYGVAFVAAVLLSMAASVVAVDSYDSLHVQGNTLLTQSGAPVRLLGVGRSGAECSKVARWRTRCR